jgi:hypothetical protein
MLNLDMVGRNPDQPMEIHGVGSAEENAVRTPVEAALEKSGLKGKLFDKVQLVGGDSDHTSFKDARIPFTFFFSGFHADYHRVTDTPDKLAYPNMVKVAKAAAHILEGVANAEKRPVFKGRGGPDFNFDNPVPPPANRRVLGITSEETTEDDYDAWKLDKGQGGVKVAKVSAGSAADKAGMLDGDIVLSVAGVKFGRTEPLADLRTALSKVEAGKEAEVVVLRDGKRVTLKAKWEK